MSLSAQITNLSNLKMRICTGAAANANITCSGIKAGDFIVGAASINGPAAYAAPADVATPTFFATNTIRTTTDTTGKAVLVLFISYPVSA